MEIALREVRGTDLPIFFQQQLDHLANFMAAFISKDPSDRDAFMNHWETILSDTKARVRTIISEENEEVLGHVASYVDSEFGKPEVTYWIGREYWGKGIATRALSEFLRREETARPIYARVVSDNLGSVRVLEKCGFKVSGKAISFAPGRNREVEELIMELKDETAQNDTAAPH
jgi:RimJ/RimL family protein N-acetyltransferase